MSPKRKIWKSIAGYINFKLLQTVVQYLIFTSVFLLHSKLLCDHRVFSHWVRIKKVNLMASMREPLNRSENKDNQFICNVHFIKGTHNTIQFWHTTFFPSASPISNSFFKTLSLPEQWNAQWYQQCTIMVSLFQSHWQQVTPK